MAIKIDPTSVKTNLTNYANTYPEFHKALKKANDTFDSLNTYWTGDRYKKIMQSWNQVVPELNKQLKVLAESSKVLNTILKNYTTADTNAINVQAANVLTLTTCNVSNKQEINFDNAKLLSDLQTVSSADVSTCWLYQSSAYSIKQFLPNPQYCYSTNDAEHEVGEIAFAKQFYVQQMADESTSIAANDTDDKVHAASFPLTTHNAVGDIAYQDACQYRPGREVCNVF